MSDAFNVYCDESCHLQKDRQRVMVLGALWCPQSRSREIAQRIREIKVKHGLAPNFEIKWKKVSKGKEQFYVDLLDYFFDDDDLHFRALVVPDKTKLDHARFAQDHDTWYFKMYFSMLNAILSPKNRYKIYLDIKDTCSGEKVSKLHEVLCNAKRDFGRQVITELQTVRSHEVEQVQLADLLIGAVSYVNRDLNQNAGKLAVIQRMRKRSGYSLKGTTWLCEDKVNLLSWTASQPA